MCSGIVVVVDVRLQDSAYLEETEAWRPDAVAYLQPTSPLRRATHIDAGLALLDAETDSVWSMVEVAEHPYYMYQPVADGRMREYVELAGKPERRQDMPPLYHVNAVLMLSKTDYLLAPGNEAQLVVNAKNFRPLIIRPEDGLDIDTEFDFQLAELLLRGQPPDALPGAAAVHAA